MSKLKKRGYIKLKLSTGDSFQLMSKSQKSQ
jgi:hypothetical protein